MEWNQYKEEFEMGAMEVVDWLENQYVKIRSGRVNLAIFDTLKFYAYGEEARINQIANLQIVDATQVLIRPYDRGTLNDIAKVISASTLGVNPQINADNIRISFPTQTEETRLRNVKRCKEILEMAKAKIRDVRKDVQNSFKKLVGVSEDTIRFFEEELNKITKDYNTNIEKVFAKKEKELITI